MMRDSTLQMKINSDEYKWENEEGLLTYNDRHAIIVRNESLAILIKTLDEVAGSEKSKEVLEVFGYRVGMMVSQSFSNRNDVENILIQFSDYYRNAGWGIAKISAFSIEDKHVVVELHNSWEHRVLKSMNKEQECIFMPSFWAGLMSN